AKPGSINWISVAWAARENTIKYKSILAELGISGGGACLVNGFSEAGGFKESFDYKSCAIGIGVTYGIKALFKVGSSPYLQKKAFEALKNGKERLRNLLIKRGISDNMADEFIEAIEKGVDDVEPTNSGNTVASGQTDNVLDEVADKAKDFVENKKETVVTNNSISDAAKKFWA